MALTGNDKTYADIMAAVQGAKDQNSINAARNRLGELNGIGAGDATNTFSSILDKAQQGIDDQTGKINSMYDNLKNSQLASAQANKDNQITELRRKLAETLPQFQTARAQADVGQQTNLNTLKEYMGNSGAFNSGDNLSRAGNIITQRGNAVNQINGNENAFTVGINNNIADANSAYNVAVNQINSNIDAQKARDLMDLQDKLKQDSQWQQQFNFNKDQANQQQNNWQNQFDYGKTQDAQQQNNWQNQFDYGKSQDSIANSLRAQTTKSSGSSGGGKSSGSNMTSTQAKNDLFAEAQSYIDNADNVSFRKLIDEDKQAIINAFGIDAYNKLYNMYWKWMGSGY